MEFLYIHAKNMIRHLLNTTHKQKIMIFNESEDEDVDFFEYAPNTTIENIQKQLRLKKYRIEIRYVVHGRKYRIVIRENDHIHFPIRKELGLTRPSISRASLIRRDIEEEHDVTNRVRKYFGQNRDFHSGLGLKIFVQDMFPFEDHEDNAERFSALYLCMSDDTEYYFDYEKNAEIIL